MHLPTILLLLTGALALPLNINLGAYSPALVVGDGALSFEGGEGEGGEGAEAILAALQGAAVAGAGAVAGGGGAGEGAGRAGEGAGRAGEGAGRAGEGAGEGAGAGRAGEGAGAGRAGEGAGEERAAAVQAASVGGMGKGILNDPSASLPSPGSSKVLDPRE